MLEMTDLSIGYPGRRLIQRLSLPQLEAGQKIAVLGPNGTGKSTLLRALAGLLPYSGLAKLNGRNIAAMSIRERARQIGYMPQFMSVDGGLTAAEALMTLHRLIGETDPERQVRGLVERFQLHEIFDRPIRALSGGQQQILNLAISLSLRPALVLLDEPISALDLRRQSQVMREAEAEAERGALVVMALHDLSMAARWADLVILLGPEVRHGTVDDLLTADTISKIWNVDVLVERSSDGRLIFLTDWRAESLQI